MGVENFSENSKEKFNFIVGSELTTSSVGDIVPPIIGGLSEELEKRFIEIEKKVDKLNSYGKKLDNSYKRIKILAENVTILEGNTKNAFDKTKEVKDMMIFVVAVIVVSFLMICTDYLSNNNVKSNFYSKDDLKIIFEENNKNTKTLECLKNKEYFSLRCFN